MHLPFPAMPAQNKKSIFTPLLTLFVAMIAIGGFSLSAMAIVEDLRFAKATDRVLWMVGLVRTVVGQLPNFAQNPGEDLWKDLVGVGQIPASTGHTNPWQGDMRASTVAGSQMRIENDLPTRDCRRMALYFLAHQPSELGLTSIEAQTFDSAVWAQIYPLPTESYSHTVENACGRATFARLALVFRVK